MTTTEYTAEYDYRVSERLGIMCDTAQPTAEQEALARKEAGEAMDALERQETTAYC